MTDVILVIMIYNLCKACEGYVRVEPLKAFEEQPYQYSDTLFQEPWWLDLVAPGAWHEVTVERDNSVIARLPYVMRKEGPMGLHIIDQPPFTNTMGPWVAPAKGKYSKRLSHYGQMISGLLEQLPRYDYFQHCLHYNMGNWLPFYWQKFSDFLSYTLIVRDLSSPEAVWDAMQPRIRNNVRKAENRLEIRDDLPLEVMIRIIRETYQFRNSREKFCEETLIRVVEECRRRDACLTLFAVGSDDQPRAVSFIVYDSRSAHFLLNGVDRRFDDSHANSFIIWESIKRCCGRTSEFNFHGNIHPQVFSYFLKFGAELQPFIQVTDKSKRMRVCDFMSRMVRKLNPFS